MRRYLVRAPMIIFCISLFHLIPVASVHPEETGLDVGGFRWNGDVEVGYRFTDIDGNENTYKQYVNLQDGLKLFDLNVLGRRNEGTAVPVDYFRLNLTGIGDPFPSGLLEVKKKATYDFLASYRQFKYYTAPEDLTLTPITNNYSFDSTIGRGVLLLSVFPREDIKVNFGYNLVQRTGDAYVPRPFYPVEKQDLDERLNDFYISGNFPIGNVDFFIKQDYWNFKNQDEIDGPYPSTIQTSGAQACIQCHGVHHFAPIACTTCHTPGSAAGLPANHQTTFSPEKRDESTGTYVSTIKAHTRLGERWELEGAFIYAHASTDADLTTTPVFATSGSADSTANTYIAELGVSYLIIKDLIFHADFRYHNIDQDGSANTDLFLGPLADSSFKQTAYTGTFQLEYVPRENLTLRGGYQVQHLDVTASPVHYAPFTGGKKPSDTTSWNQGWVGSVDWKPYKFLTVFGEYAGANISDPYTWISPENQTVGKVKIRYDTPIKNLGLRGSALWTRRTNPQQDYTRDVQDYTATATYQPIEALTMDFSYTYERITDGKDIVVNTDPFVILPNPSLAVGKVNFNSNAYIYSGGLSWDIYQGFGSGFRGSYAKTTENNPQSFCDWMVSGWYKNKYVTPIVSLERNRLVDNINPTNNFNAYLLTLSLKKEF
jgi:hypothetical protein